MNRKNIEEEVLFLFNKKYLEKLKRNRFNGKLTVSWKDGEMQHCNLTTKIVFFKGKKEDEILYLNDF